MLNSKDDKAGLSGPTLILLGLVVAALLAWLVAFAAGFVRESLDRKDFDALGNAADFLNFAYGVPVAAIGALFGILTTVVAYQVANKQGDIHLLEFAVDKSQAALKIYRRLTSALGHSLSAGIHLVKVGQELNDRLAKEGEGGPTGRMLIALSRADFTVEALSDAITNLRDPAMQELAIDTIMVLARFKDALAEMAEAVEDIIEDVFASHFTRQQAIALKPESRPLAYLRSVLPETIVTSASEGLSDNIYELAHNLRSLASGTVAAELALAFHRVPDQFRLLELLGELLLSAEFKLRNFHDYQGRKIGGYRVNLGAAYLLTVSQLVPGVDTIAKTFQSMFRGRSDAALRFLRSAFPDRGDFGLPVIMDLIDPCFEGLNRLITVEIYDKTGSHYEFYDPAQHGPIPHSGFENIPDLV